MDRRDALRTLAAAAVGTAVTPPWVERLLAAAEAHVHRGRQPGPAGQAAAVWKPKVLTARQDATVTAMTELIIPATDTPGAKAAHVNRFIDTILEDAYEAERREFLSGLDWMDARSRQLFGTDFVDAAPDQQTALLTIVSSDRNTALADREGVAFFTAIKGMTITGFYNSEVGLRGELGDDGTMFFNDDPGCGHPEHQKRA